MPDTTTVVVGAGHAGLAMSRCLSERGVDHVVLERDAVASAWRTRRDSLRLLTPSWLTRLPGFTYGGDDPDGYLTAPQVAELVEEYAVAIAAPVRTGVTVTAVRPGPRGHAVHTDRGVWHAPTVVMATGAAARAVPHALAERVPPGITTLTAAAYRRPDRLPDGGVLVVGAAASGVQIADELARSGRPVTLAVGEHVRVPRTYRGRDIFWWLEASGLLEERPAPDLVRAHPSMQLVGSRGRAVDLNALRGRGVRLVGRLVGVRDGSAQFSGSLPNVCTLADLKLGRLLDTLDGWADRTGADVAHPPQRFAPTELPAPVPLSMRLDEITTIVWATGHRPEPPGLPVLDRRGRVVHDGGVTASPGLYLIGLPFLRRRSSGLIDGAGTDARELADHLVGHLDSIARPTPVARRAS